MKPIFLLALCGALYAQSPSNRSQAPSNSTDPIAKEPITPPTGAPNDTNSGPKVPAGNEPKDPASNEPKDPAGNSTAPPLSDGAAPGNGSNGTDNANPGNTTGTAPAPKGSCAAFCKRREIRNLSSGEKAAFFNAVKKLMSGSAPTKYDNMVKLHLDATDHAHNTAYFLPWHRGYIREFERALQAIDPSICLPYWNWSVDSQAPENSPIFSNGYYGSHGDCVSDGAFGTWRPYYPRPHCLARKWKYGDNLGAFHSFEGINKIVTGSDSYDRFRSRCEMVAHPAPHVNIGGDMSEMYSPNDPLFWAHHGYVDYVWTQYQKRKGYDFSGPNGRGGSANKGDDLLGLPYKVEAVLDSHKLCYDYVDLNDNDLGGTALPPPTVAKPDAGKRPDKVLVNKVPDNEDERYSSRDRSNLNIIRYPDDADEEWCKRNKYDVKTIREYEGEYKQMYKKVNEIKGYVSPCSLWKRPTLCAPLIEKKKELYVDVKDYGRITVDYSTDVDPLQAYSNIKKRAEYCTPDVEYPEDKYRKDVENVVGKSAFGGAGTLKKVKSEDDVSGVSHQNQLAGLCVAATLAVAFNAL